MGSLVFENFEVKCRGGGDEDDDGECEQFAVVADQREGDAEFGEVEEDGSADDAEGEQGSVGGGGGDKEQDRGDQFGDAGTDAAPWLHVEGGEDVDRLWGGGEFEVEGLQEDDGGEAAESPA